MSAPVYCGAFVTVGGGVRGYASAEHVLLVAYDRRGPFTEVDRATHELRTPADLASYLEQAADVSPQLVMLAVTTWCRHRRLAEASREIVAQWTEVTLHGVPS